MPASHPARATLQRLGTALVLMLAMPAALTAEPVRSVPQLDLSRYAGLWHEIAHLPSFFQRDCVDEITAQYTLREDELIGVRNACRNQDGSLETTEGVARAVDGHPGRLQVRFAPDWLRWLPLVWADYWVIALDPGYQWAMVGTPDRDYLWILSRSPTMPRPLFERLTAQAAAMGYPTGQLVVAASLR